MKKQLSVFNFRVENKSEDTVDIYIDGDIVDASTQEIYKNYFGDETSVSYKSFRDQVNKLSAKNYNVYINSGGGLVTDAMAIHDLLIEMQDNGKTVNTIGRGIVASSATYILMAGKAPSMSSNSWLMIHNVSGFVWGDVNVIENYAATMRKFNDATNKFYQEKTGLTKTVISNMMDSETWMTADEAKEKGFVKNISGEVNFENRIKLDQWQFENTSVLNAYNSYTKNNNDHMDTKKITEAIENGFTQMLNKLGISNKKDDTDVKNAFKEFSEGITNTLKDLEPEDEKINTKVNEAVTNALKDVANNEGIKNAIKEATKNTATKEDVKNEVKEQLKDVVSKEDLKNEMSTLTNSLVEKLGGEAGAGEGEGEGKDKKNKTKTKGPKNRFSGVEWSENEA